MTAERLRAVLEYSPEKGEFTWLVDKKSYGGGVKAGDEARGSVMSCGRRYIGVDGRRYAAHRLAWLYMAGEWPVEIDHINRDPLDNRWANLREATRSQNNANVGLKSHNTSGFKGVGWDRARKLWRAQICVNQKRMLLGRFEKIEDAAEAYRAAAKKYFGEFAS